MKSYRNLISEIRHLQVLAAKRRRKEVRAAIAEIRRKMADYGITREELRGPRRKRRGASGGSGAKPGRPAGRKVAKPKRIAKRKVAPKYRDPKTGATWSGRGLTPKWLAEKERAGAKREEFLIKPADAGPKAAPKRKAKG